MSDASAETAISIAQRALFKARASMINQQPFFGALALRMLYEPRSAAQGIRTLATDGRHIFFNPDFIGTLSELELQGVIAHEVLHVANKHPTRRRQRDPEMWNIACDGAINPDLIAAGFTLPTGVVMDSKWKGLCAEEIYRELEKNPPSKSIRMAAGFGQVMDACNPSDAAGMAKAEVEAELAVRHAAMMARAMGIGKLPSSVEEMLGNINRQVQNWREILRDFIDSRSRGDYSWARPNKRMLAMGYVLPGLVPDQLGHLIIAVDTSGSISHEALEAFAAEAKAAFDEGCADRVTVVYCDCKIQRVEEYVQGDEMRLTAKGGGGTDFAPVMEWVTENASDAAALVYFTDMECHSWGEQPPMPVLWASYGSSRRCKAPFGTVVAVDEHG